MTFPMPFVPPFQSAGGSIGSPTNPANANNNMYSGDSNYPAGIQAGDLIVAHVWSNNNLTFRAASGFTLLHHLNMSTDAMIAVKIADGTESGSTGGLATSTSFRYGEGLQLIRFDKPVTSISNLNIGGGDSGNDQPASQTILTGSNGAVPVMVFASWGNRTGLTNSDITHTGGDLFGLTWNDDAYLKPRTWFWGAGETPTDISIGYTNDPGSVNTIIGAAMEIR